VTCTRDYGERRRGLVGRLVSRALKPEYAEPSIADDLVRVGRVLGAAAPPPTA